MRLTGVQRDKFL